MFRFLRIKFKIVIEFTLAYLSVFSNVGQIAENKIWNDYRKRGILIFVATKA